MKPPGEPMLVAPLTSRMVVHIEYGKLLMAQVDFVVHPVVPEALPRPQKTKLSGFVFVSVYSVWK